MPTEFRQYNKTYTTRRTAQRHSDGCYAFILERTPPDFCALEYICIKREFGLILNADYLNKKLDARRAGSWYFSTFVQC